MACSARYQLEVLTSAGGDLKTDAKKTRKHENFYITDFVTSNPKLAPRCGKHPAHPIRWEQQSRCKRISKVLIQSVVRDWRMEDIVVEPSCSLRIVHVYKRVAKLVRECEAHSWIIPFC